MSIYSAASDPPIVTLDTDDVDSSQVTDQPDIAPAANSPQELPSPIDHAARRIEKDIVLHSDEDDDVMEFFEKLTQKTKSQEAQAKPTKPMPIASDIDDDLSWLND